MCTKLEITRDNINDDILETGECCNMVLTGESDVIGTGESTKLVETDESSSPTRFSVIEHVECGINTSKECYNSYLTIAENTPIVVIELGSIFINKCCSDLQFSPTIQNIAKNVNDQTRHLLACNNKYLTCEQLNNHIHHVRSATKRNLATLCKSMELHK